MSEELSEIKEQKHVLIIMGEEREIKFDFSAWASLEEMYGGIENFDKIEEELQKTPFQTLPKLIYISLVDKRGVTESNVLSGYYPKDIERISSIVFNALSESLPKDDKKKVTPKMEK